MIMRKLPYAIEIWEAPFTDILLESPGDAEGWGRVQCRLRIALEVMGMM